MGLLMSLKETNLSWWQQECTLVSYHVGEGRREKKPLKVGPEQEPQLFPGCYSQTTRPTIVFHSSRRFQPAD